MNPLMAAWGVLAGSVKTGKLTKDEAYEAFDDYAMSIFMKLPLADKRVYMIDDTFIGFMVFMTQEHPEIQEKIFL